MLLKPYFILQRRRLFVAGLAAIFLPVFVLFFITGNIGTLWHTACRCTPEPDDLRILLNSLSLSSVLLSFILGFAGSLGTKLPSYLSFNLTRPASRAEALFMPFALATASMAILPVLGASALYLGLWATHAPVLRLLRADLGFLPGVSTLGTHSGLPEIAAAMQLGRRYLAGLLLGMDASALFVSTRWLTQSSRPWLKFMGAVSDSACYVFLWISPRSVLFFSPRHSPTTLLPPSNLNLSLHLLFAVAWLLFTYRVLVEVEL